MGTPRTYWVYILSSRTGVLYAGVTNDLQLRLEEHREGMVEGFTKRYREERLVYFEKVDDIQSALAREKQIKSWTRPKKHALVREANPTFKDLGNELV